MNKDPFCYELCVYDHFDAAHWVDIPLSPCRSLHGHSWKVEAYVRTNCCGSNGISVDFREIRTYLRNICNNLDHCNLNEKLSFPPSAEFIAKYICEELGKSLDSIGVKVWKIMVREGEGSVTYLVD